MKWVLVLIGWVVPKVNGLDFKKWALVLIGWVGPKVNGLDLRCGLWS